MKTILAFEETNWNLMLKLTIAEIHQNIVQRIKITYVKCEVNIEA
jgi:hypothetical protein